MPETSRNYAIICQGEKTREKTRSKVWVFELCLSVSTIARGKGLLTSGARYTYTDPHTKSSTCRFSISVFLYKQSWLVVLTILKNITQWEGLSRILWKIKHVWNHQPESVRDCIQPFACDTTVESVGDAASNATWKFLDVQLDLWLLGNTATAVKIIPTSKLDRLTCLWNVCIRHMLWRRLYQTKSGCKLETKLLMWTGSTIPNGRFHQITTEYLTWKKHGHFTKKLIHF